MATRMALAVLLLVSRAAADTPKADPATLARAAIEAPLGFSRFIFDGEKFPEPSLEPRQRYLDLFGPFQLHATFFDRDFKPVKSAAAPGFYGAIVELKPESGPVLRRYYTLLRTPGPVADELRFDPNFPAGLAPLGLNPGLLTDQSELIAARWRNRPFKEAACDPNLARVLGGLALSKIGIGNPRKDNDALAIERQWWVTMKRRRWGLDREFPTPVQRPIKDEERWNKLVAIGTEVQAGVKTGTAKKLDALCKEWAENDDQAFGVCVTRRGIIVLHAAYGVRDGKPMEVTTKSWMASITKPMSATLLMMLVDQGLVRLDDPVSKFLPPLRDIKVEKPLLIRHLPTHTAGLASWPKVLNDDTQPDLEERIALASPHLKVGQEWAYNGQSYALMGKVIEAVSGEALPQFYRNHLLDPLGCADTDVAGTHADAFSVPLDMACFGQMLLNRGGYGNKRFLREESFAQMLPRPLIAELGKDAKKIFGIGLDGTEERFGHGAASAAFFQIDGINQTVVVITRNKMGKNQNKYQQRFLEILNASFEAPKNN